MPPNQIKFDQDKEWEKLKSDSYWNEAEHMPILVRLLMKTGMGRRAAYYTLFGILIVCTFITFKVVESNFFSGAPVPKVYIEDITPEVQQAIPPEILKKLPSRNGKK